MNSQQCYFLSRSKATQIPWNSGERPRFHDITRPINELLERFKEGIEGHKKAVIGSLFQRYLDVEKVFLFLFLFFF